MGEGENLMRASPINKSAKIGGNRRLKNHLPVPANVKLMLTFAEEKACISQGYTRIAGIDEVGRGCIAGPLIAAAVIMPINKKPRWFYGVNDSKRLSAKQREAVFTHIQQAALGIGIGTVSSQEIDAGGMTAANRKAMTMAVNQIFPLPDFLLIEFFKLPDLCLPQKSIIDGDSCCFCIACASIVAKVCRDRLMKDLDSKYPGYGLAENKGYGTREHIASLHKLGPSPIHRRLFEPVQNVLQRGISGLP